MATEPEFAQFIADQLSDLDAVTTRRMFGEYALYSNGKVVGLFCDNRLFVKPSEAGRAFIGDPVMAPAFNGAKPSFLIEDRLDDRRWLSELVSLTENDLPPPKIKKRKSDLLPPKIKKRKVKFE